MRPLIRPSREDDIAAIAAIYAPAVLHGTASFEREPPSETEMARRRAALVLDGYPYLVAEIEGSVVGYAYAGPFRARPAYASTVEDSIYVAPDLQGRGVGRILLGALIESCERMDFRLMVAVIGDAASMGSIRLHETAGFSHAGRFDGIGYKHGRWLASVLMQRPLGAGTSIPPSRGNQS